MVELTKIFAGSERQLKYPEKFERVQKIKSVEMEGIARNMNLTVKTKNGQIYSLHIDSQIVYGWISRFRDQIPQKNFVVGGSEYNYNSLFPDDESPVKNRQLNDIRVKVLALYVNLFVCPEKCE